MKQYKAYVFDFDYTLANSERAIVDCFQHVLKGHGYMNISNDAIKATIGYHLRDAFPMLLPGIKEEFVTKLREEFTEIADQLMTKETELFPEVIPMLRGIKARGAKAAIVSTKRRARIQEGIEKFQIWDLVDLVVGDEDVRTPKPDPEGIRKAMELLKVGKDDTLYIGDTILDAEAATNAEVDFVGVTTGTTPKEVLEKYSNIKIVPDLGQLLE